MCHELYCKSYVNSTAELYHAMGFAFMGDTSGGKFGGKFEGVSRPHLMQPGLACFDNGLGAVGDL